MLELGIKKAKDGLCELASSCIKNNSIYKINTKKGNVVLLSENHYNNLIESLYLAGIKSAFYLVLSTDISSL